MFDSDWSIGSHDLLKLPLQFSTKLSSSGGVIFLKKEYSLILVCDFCSIGYEGPIFHKNGSTRGVNYLKIRGARGVPFMDNTLETWIILAKNAGCLLYILFSSS